jgi:hypothetical protein
MHDVFASTQIRSKITLATERKHDFSAFFGSIHPLACRLHRMFVGQ